MKQIRWLAWIALCLSLALTLCACEQGENGDKQEQGTTALTSLNETSDAPDEDTGSAPDADDTTAPDEDDTTAPDADDTTVPDVDDTTVPDVDDTTVPDVDDTTAPDAGDTTAPDVDDTTAPDAGDTTVPDVGDTTVPDVDDPEPLPIYNVSVIAPVGVTLDGVFSGEAGSDVLFTATVDGDYRLHAVGAEAVGEAEYDSATDLWHYTYRVPAIAADTDVTVGMQKIYWTDMIAAERGAVTQSGMLSYGTLELQLPSAGRYIIYEVVLEEDEALTGVTFGANVSGPSYAAYYTFEAEKAGAYTLKTKLFDLNWKSGAEKSYVYYLASVEDVVLPALSGEGFLLPARARVNVTVTLPAQGLYTFSTNAYAVALNDSLGGFTAYVGADELTYTFTAFVDSSELEFAFDWSICALDDGAVAMGDGDTALTVAPTGYTAFTFTAPEDGIYYISATTSDVYVNHWDSTYNTMLGRGERGYAATLTAGETVTLYCSADPNAVVSEAVETAVRSLKLGEIADGSRALADAAGVLNSYMVSAEGDYMITPGSGVSYSFDGETWYTASQVFALEAGYCNFYVKKESAQAAGNVNFRIEKQKYEAVLSLGDTTVTFVPDKEYTVYLPEELLTSTAGTIDILLTWEDADLTVSVNGEACTSGVSVSISTYTAYTVTALYAGDAAGKVTLSLVDENLPVIPPMIEGDAYMVYFYGVDFYSLIFNAEQGLVRIENLQDGTNNGIYHYAVTDGAYTFTAEDGTVVDFIIGANASGGMTFQAPGMYAAQDMVSVESVPEGDTPEAEESELVGDYVVTYEGAILYEITFGADGTVTVTDRNGTAQDGVFSYTVGDGGLPVADTDAFLFGKDPGGNLTVQFAASPSAFALTRAEEASVSRATAVIGENTVRVTDAEAGTTCTFTATAAGTYVVTVTDTNGVIFVEDATGGVNYYYGDSFEVTLRAGSSTSFIVLTRTFAADTVELTITQA